MSGWGKGLLDSVGNLRASISVPGTSLALGTSAGIGDGANNAPARIPVAAYGVLFNGATWDRERGPIVFKTIQGIAVVSGTPVTIWTPAAGKKFRLMGWMLAANVANTFVVFKEGGVESIRTAPMAANVGVASPPIGNGILANAANDALQIDVNNNCAVNGFVFGTEE